MLYSSEKKVKDRTEDFSVEEWDGETGRHTAEKPARREGTYNTEIWRYIHTHIVTSCVMSNHKSFTVGKEIHYQIHVRYI